MIRPPALWLPDYLTPAKAAREQGGDPLDFLVVQLGYKEIFGQAASWEAVRERLNRYNLEVVLGLASKISAFLNNVPRQALDAGQRLICAGLFGEAGKELWQRATKALNPDARVMVLFGELQLINLVKVALLVLPLDDRASDADLAPLGEAMLMISELMWAQMHPPVPAGERSDDLPPEWQQAILANGLFHAGGTWRDDLARSRELYLTDRPNLRGHPDYVDLPERVRVVIGMEPRILMSVLIAFYSHWATFDARALKERAGGFDSRAYFTRNYSFSPEQAQSFLGLCAADVDAAHEAVRGRYTLEKLDPLDFLPLAKTPLIQVGHMVYLASAKLLAAKLTRGLFHLFLEPRRTSHEERDRFLRFMGVVFEDYVACWLERVAPVRGRYIPEHRLRARLGDGKSCDGLVWFPDLESVVLIECKAALFPHEVRTARNCDMFDRLVQNVFMDAGAQLSATIDAIEGGALREEGIPPGSIHSYLPVIVTPDDVATSPPIYRRIQSELARQGVLTQREARPPQTVTIAELEGIEEDLLAGESLQRILAEKVSLDDWRDQPLRNYCWSRRPDLGHKTNQRLLAVVDALFQDARAFFQDHAQTDDR